MRFHVVWISALLFIFWKSPFSEGLIDAYNQVAPMQITRVVDYTDLVVLLMLPIPYYLMRYIDRLKVTAINRIHPVFVLFPVMIAFMATQPPRYYYYTRSQGNLKCFNCYVTLRYNQDELVTRLKEHGIVFDSILNFGCLEKGERIRLQ
jgi:hypothetical protein